MMKTKYIIGLIWLATSLSACNSLFDDELPKSQIAAKEAIKDQASAETALLGVYSYLGEYGIFSAYFLVDDAYRCGLLEGTYRGQNYERYLELLEIPSEHNELLNKWKLCGQMINAANNLLEGIEKVPDNRFIENRKSEIIAETRFMRAFAQLYLMKHYAFWWDIDSEYGPLMRRVPGKLSNNNMKRSNVKEAYGMILDDLDYAINNGPDFSNVYRVSKGLAKAYKIETLLLRGQLEDYAAVPQMADDVVADYGFKMENTYADFVKNGYESTELMFSRYLSEKKLTDVDTNVASIKKLMCGSYKPNDQFFSIFNEENDARYTEAFDSVMYDKVNSTRKTLVLKKIWRSNGDCPMCYMRLAQMYLFKAEALATSGASVKEVLAPLNVLRERSGNELYDEKDFTDRDELIKAVFNETVREIGLENGSEFFVAARMRLTSGKRLLTEYNSIFRDDKQLAWQIPDDEMKYNILMVANPIFAQE